MTRYLTNPLFLYLAVWGSVTVLYVGGLEVGLFPPALPQVRWAVVLNVAAFSLGYATWNVLARSKTNGGTLLPTGAGPLTVERLKYYLNVTLGFGVLAVMFCAARVAIVARAHAIDLRFVVSDPRLWRDTLTSVITPDMIGVRVCTIAITVTSSVFSIGFVLLGIWLYFGRGRSRYIYLVLFLLAAFGVGLFSLARKEVTINILFMVLSYLFVHQLYRTRRPHEVAWHLTAPAAALLVLFLLIEALLRKGATYGYKDWLTGFLFSVYWYLASPLAAFGEFLRSFDHDWRLGQSLFFPIYKRLVGFDLLPPSDTTAIVYMEMIFIPYATNVYTYMRNIYEDFGFVGLAAFPYLVGALSASLRPRAERLFSYLNLYMIVLVVIIFSFYDYLLISNQLYLQTFFGFVFFHSELQGLDDTSQGQGSGRQLSTAAFECGAS